MHPYSVGVLKDTASQVPRPNSCAPAITGTAHLRVGAKAEHDCLRNIADVTLAVGHLLAVFVGGFGGSRQKYLPVGGTQSGLAGRLARSTT
jgi:hypothetical protein